MALLESEKRLLREARNEFKEAVARVKVKAENVEQLKTRFKRKPDRR